MSIEGVGLVLATAALNLPFGAYRMTVRKFSLKWFLSIHLPIPFIFLLRTAIGYSPWFIPWLVIGAGSGQIIGGRVFSWYRRRHMNTVTPVEAECDTASSISSASSASSISTTSPTSLD